MELIAADAFVAAAQVPALAHGDIHLWFFDTPRDADDAATLRALLAAYLDCAPQAIALARDAHGKPYLAAPRERAVEFSLAHSQGRLAVAVSRDIAVGVDIEAGTRSRPFAALARRYFDADEAQALAALPGPALGAAFLALWSCKEAVLKAIGRGIAYGLERVAFTLDAHGRPTRLSRIGDAEGPAAAWQLRRLAPAAGVVGALAWRGPPQRLRALRRVAAAATAAQHSATIRP